MSIKAYRENPVNMNIHSILTNNILKKENTALKVTILRSHFKAICCVKVYSRPAVEFLFGRQRF